jgi:hypothetical protein
MLSRSTSTRPARSLTRSLTRGLSSRSLSRRVLSRSATLGKLSSMSNRLISRSAGSSRKLLGVSRSRKGGALAIELRRRILLMCKRAYWNQLEEGTINRDAASYLRRLSDMALGTETAQLFEWATIEEALSSEHMISGLQAGPLTRCLKRFFEYLLSASPTIFGVRLFGWCTYPAGRLEVRSIELRHNVLVGFLNARCVRARASRAVARACACAALSPLSRRPSATSLPHPLVHRASSLPSPPRAPRLARRPALPLSSGMLDQMV